MLENSTEFPELPKWWIFFRRMSKVSALSNAWLTPSQTLVNSINYLRVVVCPVEIYYYQFPFLHLVSVYFCIIFH